MSKKVAIGNITIGGGEKIAVQSMSTKRPSDTDNAVKEAERLILSGCEILRFSVLDDKDALALKEIKKRLSIPIVADIHFDYRLAIAAIESGVDKIRINPGNIGSEENVKKVAEALKSSGTAVRVGSNTGSIEKEFLAKFGKNEISLGESALKNVAVLEKYGLDNIVISVKASSVPLTVKAYEYVSSKTDYPLHIGVTEAGTEFDGIIKNSMGIGALLLRGIGDTLRVSLSSDPVKEVECARAILSGLNLIDDYVKVVACPTCGRCGWGCMDFAEKVTDYVKNKRKNLTIAVMGCAVNGPGEAADADLGIAGGNGRCIIFKKGKIADSFDENSAKEAFFKEIDLCLR